MRLLGVFIDLSFTISGDKAGWCVDKSSAVVTEFGRGHGCLREGPKRSTSVSFSKEDGSAVTRGTA